MAAVAACELVRQPLILVTGSRYVRNGVLKLVAGADPAESRHADRWYRFRVRARMGTLRAWWTPSHQTAE
eukprot:11182493-Lingulodinium_polyedra.AAC.1